MQRLTTGAVCTRRPQGVVINWQRWLSPRPRALLCIDLSATHLTVLRVERSVASTLSIKGFYRQPLTAGAVVERQIVEFEPLLEQLRTAVQTLDAAGCEAAIAVPTAAAISKRLELPAQFSDEQLEELLGFEIEQHIPYPADEICWDFQRLGSAESALSPVQLVACRREYVESREALLLAAGLQPILVDVENLSLQRAVTLLQHQLPDSAQVVALVDIGEHSLTLAVIMAGELLYSREKPRASAAALPTQGLVEQIGRELQFFYASSPYNFVDQLLVAGVDADQPQLLTTLAHSSGLNCQLADPLAAVKLADALDSAVLRSQGFLLLPALGLAVGSEKWS